MTSLFKLFYECTGVSTDTRNISKNQLFIALKGEHFNGNIYAKQALEKGAKFAIVDEEVYADNLNIFFVKDSLIFLQKLAEYHRNQFQIPIIGITGSNGKTTTKELIAHVLQKKYKVLYTKGNLNNHIGVPLTLLNLKKEHEIAVIEMGASKLGDIKELTDISHPNFGIITNIGTAHIEGFKSLENIIQTKTELFRAANEKKGHLFVNIDDSILTSKIPDQCTTSTYGIEIKGDITGKILSITPELNIQWQTEYYTSPALKIQMIGKYNFYNILAAICIGNHFQVDYSTINKAIKEYKPSNNRSQLEKTDNNTLILDAYNANPTSVRYALENFNEMIGENKFFILGDMLELGEQSLQYHQEIISLTQQLNIQGIFIGENYLILSEKNNILAFKTTKDAQPFLKTASPKHNLILLKGSRGIGLEKLVDIL